MITFTSTPVGGKIVPQIPRKPEENVPQRPLGGLITNPNPTPKSPRTPQPLGGLVMPPKTPGNDEFVPRPLGGLIAPPKTPKREDLPPVRPKETPSPEASDKKGKIAKTLKFLGAAAIATAIVVFGPKVVNKILHR